MQEWRNAFEILIFIAWGLTLWRSIVDGRPYITIFLGATAFGLLVEHVGASPRMAGSAFPCTVIHDPSDPVKYCYGNFLWMPWGVPVCIGLAWGVILHTVLRVTSRLRDIRWVMRPFFAASLGICLDAIMDPVASNFVAVDGGRSVCKGPGLEMWFWTDDLRSVYAPVSDGLSQASARLPSIVDGLPYCHTLVAEGRLTVLDNGRHFHLFDVPLTNFFGWWFVIFLFTFGAQLVVWLAAKRWGQSGAEFLRAKPLGGEAPGSAKLPLWREILVVVLSVVVGAGLTWAAMKYYVNDAYLGNSRWLALSFVLLMLLPGPLAFVYYLPRLKRSQPIDTPVIACLLLFVGFFLPPLWWYDMDDQYPLLIFFAPILAVVATVLFTWPYRNRIRRAVFNALGWRQRAVIEDDSLAPG